LTSGVRVVFVRTIHRKVGGFDELGMQANNGTWNNLASIMF
jgi:hypothetical protein